MKKMFLMMLGLMMLFGTGCQKRPDECEVVVSETTVSPWEEEDWEFEELKRKHEGHECDLMEYVDDSGTGWACYDEYCKDKNIGNYAPKSSVSAFYDDSTVFYCNSDNEAQEEAIVKDKVKRGVYTTSELLYGSDETSVDQDVWKQDTSYRVILNLGPDVGIDGQRFVVDVSYPSYVRNGHVGTILVEVSTDEEVFVGSLSFVAEGSLNLVHGSSVDTSETIHIDIFDGELWLEFYTGATSEHYRTRPEVDSGSSTGPYTTKYSFKRHQSEGQPEPKNSTPQDTTSESMNSMPSSISVTEKETICWPEPTRPENCTEAEMEAETEAEMETEMKVEMLPPGELQMETGAENIDIGTGGLETTMSRVERDKLCFFPSTCYSGSHTALCDIALNDYLQGTCGTGGAVCECPRRNSGIHRPQCPYSSH